MNLFNPLHHCAVGRPTPHFLRYLLSVSIDTHIHTYVDKSCLEILNDLLMSNNLEAVKYKVSFLKVRVRIILCFFLAQLSKKDCSG